MTTYCGECFQPCTHHPETFYSTFTTSDCCNGLVFTDSELTLEFDFEDWYDDGYADYKYDQMREERDHEQG